MDRLFLKQISEAYLIDADITNNKKESINDIFEYLIQVIENIKYNDYQEYLNLHKLSRKEQQEILYDIISEDIYNHELIHENFLNAITAGFKMAGQLPQTIVTTLTALNQTAEEAKNVVSKTLKGEQARIATNILYRRLDKCSKMCGIKDDTEIDTFAALALFKRGIYSNRAREQSECLANCYFVYHAEMIALFAHQYKDCVRKTSGKDIRINLNIFSENPLDGVCNTYHNLGLNYMVEYKKAVSALYHEHDKGYKLAMGLLEKELNKYNKYQKGV